MYCEERSRVGRRVREGLNAATAADGRGLKSASLVVRGNSVLWVTRRVYSNGRRPIELTAHFRALWVLDQGLSLARTAS